MEIYRTKISFFWLFLYCVIFSISTYLAGKCVTDSLIDLLTLIFIFPIFLIGFYLLMLAPVKRFIFFENHFIIATPFVSLFIAEKKFFYSEIKFARITRHYKGPDTFVIRLKNNTTFKCPYIPRALSNDSDMIGRFLIDRGIDFHYRDFNKINRIGTDNWIRIPEDLK